ncbi:MAG: DUF262 domain-containing protein [Deltaproteobacteria bacterium]|nr:DUF262 domain-containing protein [Deltaproteobacteria bacterium]
MKGILDEVIREMEDEYSNDDLYNIKSWGADLTFREIISMYDEDELVKPELQRNYVWTKAEASRFIESLLFGLPIPSIFLARTKEEKHLIIDGYQRIMTVRDYVKGKFSHDGVVFRLTNSKRINERWRNKAFIELSDSDQRRIRNTTIHAIIFEQIKPSDEDSSLYQVFERINTGGRTLNPQEIRNCVYQGPLNSLLISLNSLPSWRLLFGTESPDVRMLDLELILRFMFFSTNYKSIVSSDKRVVLKKSLNDFMGKRENNGEGAIERLRNSFTMTMNFIMDRFGEAAFFSITKGKKRLHFHPAIFDAISVATFNMLSSDSRARAKDFSTAQFDLLTDTLFTSAISEKTTDPINIKTRVDKAVHYLFT